MVQLTICLDNDTAKRLEAEAQLSKRPKSEFIRLTIESHFEALDKKRARGKRKAA